MSFLDKVRKPDPCVAVPAPTGMRWMLAGPYAASCWKILCLVPDVKLHHASIPLMWRLADSEGGVWPAHGLTAYLEDPNRLRAATKKMLRQYQDHELAVADKRSRSAEFSKRAAIAQLSTKGNHNEQ